MDPVKNVLVPVDFGPPSLRACDRAMSFAADLRAELTLLHVVDAGEHALLADGIVHLREIAERTMRGVAKKLRPARTRVVEGSPAEAIVSAIENERADLVVCGTHNRRGLAYLALGSVAERVVRTSPVPVLTVPGHCFESREEAGERLTMELRFQELSGAASVVALGINAVPIAEAVARRLDAPLDVWHFEPITMNGRTVGALGEDELAYYDEPHCDPSFARIEAEARAKESLREELLAVRGTGDFGDVLDRAVVLVPEVVSGAAPVRAAVRVLRRIGAKRIVLAAPVAYAEAVAEIRELVDGLICLEQTFVARPEDIAFRRPAPPSYRTVRRLLKDWRPGAESFSSPTRHAS